MAILRTTRSRIATAAIATLAVVGLGTFGAMRVNANAPDKAAAPLPEVDVATVVPQTVTDWQSYSGRLEAVEKVDVRPQVSGTIVAVNFKDGALVKKGDVLFVIDPRPYQAETDRAAAQLAAAQARNGYAQSDWQRAQRLIGDNAIAKRDYDEKQNAAREASANLKAAEAALETARINLGYTRITAPVSGRVSRAEITVGNVVSAGAAATPLTTLVSVSPIYASFDADEQTYLQYINGARDGRKVPVELGLANETGYSRSGVIDSVDNRLDTSSGTIRVRARFDNADGTLVPGLYAREGRRQRAAPGIARRRCGDQHRPGQEVRVRRRPAGPRVVPRSAAGHAARQPARDRERACRRRSRDRERHAARAPGRAGQAAHGADDGRRRSVRAARGRREAGRTGEGGIVSGTPLRFPRSTRQSHP
jgi:multidrug efflux system membrane fusion protein